MPQSSTKPVPASIRRAWRRRAVSFVGRAYSHDPLDRVDLIGGVNSDRSVWRMSQTAAIAAIESGTDEFYFQAGPTAVMLTVVTHEGQKYLKTERETTHPDDLLSLAAS